MNNEYIAVQHVYALGKSWPVCKAYNTFPVLETFYYVEINDSIFTGDDVEELQEEIDHWLKR